MSALIFSMLGIPADSLASAGSTSSLGSITHQSLNKQVIPLQQNTGIQGPQYYNGYNRGYRDGYDAGQTDCEPKSYEAHYDNVHQNDTSEYGRGYTEGYQSGYGKGFQSCREPQINLSRTT